MAMDSVNTRFTVDVKDRILEILGQKYPIMMSLYLWKNLGLSRLAMSGGVGQCHIEHGAS